MDGECINYMIDPLNNEKENLSATIIVFRVYFVSRYGYKEEIPEIIYVLFAKY
jgi:hypothetical protein